MIIQKKIKMPQKHIKSPKTKLHHEDALFQKDDQSIQAQVRKGVWAQHINPLCEFNHGHNSISDNGS